MPQLTVLITGAAGRIGQTLRQGFAGRYVLRSFDRRPVPGDPEAVVAELEDLGALKRATEGTDAVVHLAANPSSEAPFIEQLVPANIIGVYNVLRASRESGVRRVVFASSSQAVTGYPISRTIEADDPVCPSSLYGATKAFGEVLGRYYHDHHGLEFIAIRVGTFIPAHRDWPRDPAERPDRWLGAQDAVELFRRAIETPDIGYAIVFGTSQVSSERLSLKTARDLLGYVPQERLPHRESPL